LTGDAETLKLIKAAAKSAVRYEIEAIKREQLQPERMEVEAEVEVDPEAEMEAEPAEEPMERLRGRPELIEDEETLAAIRLANRLHSFIIGALLNDVTQALLKGFSATL
jgi:hypothetical protein